MARTGRLRLPPRVPQSIPPGLPDPPEEGPKRPETKIKSILQKTREKHKNALKNSTLNPTVNLRGFIGVLPCGSPVLGHPAHKNTQTQHLVTRSPHKGDEATRSTSTAAQGPQRGPNEANHDGRVARTGRHPRCAKEAQRPPKTQKKHKTQNHAAAQKKQGGPTKNSAGQKQKTQNTHKIRP